MKFLHTMIRVTNLEQSIEFYTKVLGMTVLNRFENRDYRYTLVFVGYKNQPDGTNIEELDPKNQREFTSLPYGYLLGRLGEEGKPFPIGLNYTYRFANSIPIYIQDKSNNFFFFLRFM